MEWSKRWFPIPSEYGAGSGDEVGRTGADETESHSFGAAGAVWQVCSATRHIRFSQQASSGSCCARTGGGHNTMRRTEPIPIKISSVKVNDVAFLLDNCEFLFGDGTERCLVEDRDVDRLIIA